MEQKQLPRILVCDDIHEAGLNLLRPEFALTLLTNLSQSELAAELPHYDGLIARHSKITAGMMAHAPRLKIIGNVFHKLDNIDVSYAKEKRVKVVYAPDANTVATAEHTMGLLLAMARRLPWAEAGLQQGTLMGSQFMGTGLAGKTLGIVGFGRIGRQVAIRAQAFDMEVLVNEIHFTPELALEANVKLVDLDDLLEQSDFVSLHATLTPETTHMIGQAQLGRMKPKAFLINTAQGELIDEDALVEALDSGQIAGAAVDVFVGEASAQHPLVRHPRIIATPHIAAFTEDATRQASVAVAKQLIDAFAQMEAEPILPLRVVASERVFPHELIDEKRVQRLADAITAAGVLKNPPLVMETEGGYVVLDGATRSTALQKMGLPHMLVQVFSAEEEGLQLKTWYHVIRQLDKASLLNLLNGISAVNLIPSDEESVTEKQLAYGSLCTIHFTDGEILLVQARAGANRLEVLNELTSAYISASLTSRTLNRNVGQLQHEYKDMVALAVFPVFEVGQVMQLALAGRRLPAGITRFIVPGRILRINMDLEILRGEQSVQEKNRWLQEHLVEKQKEGRIRFYAEPVFLLDE